MPPPSPAVCDLTTPLLQHPVCWPQQPRLARGFGVIVYAHIATNAVIIASGWVAMLSSKGGQLHRLAGSAFVIAVMCTVLLGIMMIVLRLWKDGFYPRMSGWCSCESALPGGDFSHGFIPPVMLLFVSLGSILAYHAALGYAAARRVHVPILLRRALSALCTVGLALVWVRFGWLSLCGNGEPLWMTIEDPAPWREYSVTILLVCPLYAALHLAVGRLSIRGSAHGPHMVLAFSIVNTILLGDVERNRFWSLAQVTTPLPANLLMYILPCAAAVATLARQCDGSTAISSLRHPLIAPPVGVTVSCRRS